MASKVDKSCLNQPTISKHSISYGPLNVDMFFKMSICDKLITSFLIQWSVDTNSLKMITSRQRLQICANAHVMNS